MIEYQKSQRVRLYDMFLLGPFLVYIAMKKGALTDWEKFGIGFIAITTILYNGRNYLKNREKND